MSAKNDTELVKKLANERIKEIQSKFFMHKGINGVDNPILSSNKSSNSITGKMWISPNPDLSR